MTNNNHNNKNQGSSKDAQDHKDVQDAQDAQNNVNQPTQFEQFEDELIPFNMPEVTITPTLPESICKEIDKWLLRYPPDQKRSGVYFALSRVQEENNGSLTVPLMDAVAHYLGLPKIAVYEIAAFYTMFHLNPVGNHIIDVCTNISCMLNGAEKIVEHLQQKLQIKLNETTADGRFTLKEVECLGACIAAPVCQIGKQFYENLSAERIDEILAGLK